MAWCHALSCHAFTCHARPCQNHAMPRKSVSCCVVIASCHAASGTNKNVFRPLSTGTIWIVLLRAWRISDMPSATGTIHNFVSGCWTIWEHIFRSVFVATYSAGFWTYYDLLECPRHIFQYFGTTRTLLTDASGFLIYPDHLERYVQDLNHPQQVPQQVGRGLG